MKNSLTLISIVLVISLFLPGCQAIADIFKAGMWSGIIIVVLIVGLILFLVGRGRRNS